jgi:dihydroorotase
LDCLDKIENFATRFGADFYGIPYQTQTITLERGETKVADIINSVVPFRAGQTLTWKLV